MATKATEKKIEEVKELLNQIVIKVGRSTDPFLEDVAETAKAFLKPTPEESEDHELDEDEDYYDSDCYEDYDTSY